MVRLFETPYTMEFRPPSAPRLKISPLSPGQKPKSFAEKMERTGEIIANTAQKLARLKRSMPNKGSDPKESVQDMMIKSHNELIAAQKEAKESTKEYFSLKGKMTESPLHETIGGPIDPYDPADDGFYQVDGVWTQTQVTDYPARVAEIKRLESYGFRVTEKTKNQFIIEKDSKTAMITLQEKPRFIFKQANKTQSPLNIITPQIIERLLS